MATIPCVPVDPQSLEWCEGAVNLPGIRSKVYFIPKRNIALWPTLPDVVTSGIGDLATYVGDFVLVAGKEWQEMDVLVEESPVKSASQGTKPGKTFLNTGTFYSPKVDADATGLARVANNGDYVWLFQEKPGKYRVIGNEMYQTDHKIDQSLGSKATDQMGTPFEASVTDKSPAPYYVGEIKTANGTINENTSATIVLTTLPATKSQSVAVNVGIKPIDYYYAGVLGVIVWTATTPTGIVVDTSNAGVVIITGAPTAAGIYNYEIPVTGDNGITAKATGSITVTV